MSDTLGVSPIKLDGTLKTAEEAFVEAYEVAKKHAPKKRVNFIAAAKDLTPEHVGNDDGVNTKSLKTTAKLVSSSSPQRSIGRLVAKQMLDKISELTDVFLDDGVSPLALARILIAKYRQEWLEWEPETLWSTIEREFKGVSEVNKNKVNK